MDAATASTAAALRPNTLVIYETTLPVGTTRSRFAPMLTAGSGLTLGLDLFVAFSPERVYSGRIFADLRQYPKLVGGLDVASTDRAVEFYTQALQFDQRSDLSRANGVWNLDTAEAAELAKLAETTYRDINIGFANELADSHDRHGIDVSRGDRGVQQPAVQSHPSAGYCRRGPLHPGLSQLLSGRRPRCATPGSGTPGQRWHARVRGRPLARDGISLGRPSRCWVPPIVGV